MRRLAIVTQDPANLGGVLRLAEYIYRRSEAIGLEPALVHYGRFAEHPELHVSAANLLRGEINFRVAAKSYEFRGMRACAIGACFPEWEPNRLKANGRWKRVLAGFDAFLLVTGSAHTGLPLADCKKHFTAWVSSRVTEDRKARLAKPNVSNFVERLGLPAVERAEKRTLDVAERVLAVSTDAAAHVGRVTNKKIEVWPYPIDTERFCPVADRANGGSGSDDPLRFLFVGRANDPRKRVDLFFESCRKFQSYYPNIFFEAVVVSRELPESRTFDFPVRHVPFASEGELIALYRSANALLVTSEQEGLGIAALEAMACGVPVISTRCGGPEMFIEEGVNGFLVDAEAERFASRMAELGLDAERQRQFRNAACGMIESRYSEHVWNPKFEAMLRSL